MREAPSWEVTLDPVTGELCAAVPLALLGRLRAAVMATERTAKGQHLIADCIACGCNTCTMVTAACELTARAALHLADDGEVTA